MNRKKGKISLWEIRVFFYSLILMFIFVYLLFLKILSLSVDILIGINLVCLFVIMYFVLSDWLNFFFKSKSKKVYLRIMKLFFLLNQMLILNSNVYESFFNLFKVNLLLLNNELTNFVIIINELKNKLVIRFYVNILMKYFLSKLKFVFNLSSIWFKDILFLNEFLFIVSFFKWVDIYFLINKNNG